MMLIKERQNMRRLSVIVSVLLCVQMYRNVANCEDSRSMQEFRRNLYRKDDGEKGIESEPIEYGEAAFYARLELDKNKACEGALIKTNYVLTVASATKGPFIMSPPWVESTLLLKPTRAYDPSIVEGGRVKVSRGGRSRALT
uniref:Uncharacterized protein n=1 Tax=Timema bartmani TaxID=61472 RepID=A0A7R9FD48_9NEOP|nr:unnamed protein product [Timema bartmani]